MPRETEPLKVPAKDPLELEEDEEAKERKEVADKKGAAKDETKEGDRDEEELTPEERQLKVPHLHLLPSMCTVCRLGNYSLFDHVCHIQQKCFTPLQEHLEETVEIVVKKVESKEDEEAQLKALEDLRKEIRNATSSMTSVPLPLKFLQPHYAAMKEAYLNLAKGGNKIFLADVLSVMAMTMGKSGARESLKFRLQGTPSDLGSWGHEYVRNLAGEIGMEWEKRQEEGDSITDLEVLVDDIVPFKMKHNAEVEGFDLLMEVIQCTEGREATLEIVPVPGYFIVCGLSIS